VAPWPLLGAERQISKASPPAWAGPSYPGVEIGRILEEVQMTPVLPAGVVTLGPAGTACRTGEFAAWRKVDSDVDSLLFRRKLDLCDPPGFLEPQSFLEQSLKLQPPRLLVQCDLHTTPLPTANSDEPQIFGFETTSCVYPFDELLLNPLLFGTIHLGIRTITT